MEPWTELRISWLLKSSRPDQEMILKNHKKPFDHLAKFEEMRRAKNFTASITIGALMMFF